MKQTLLTQFAPLVLTVFVAVFARAGVLEDLSQASNWTHTFWRPDNCSQQYDEARAKVGLRRASLACAPATSNLSQQTLGLTDIADHLQESAEDKLVGVLAAKQAKELSCSADFAEQVSSGKRADVVSDVNRSLSALRALKQQIVKSTQSLMQSPTVTNKACPLSADELKPTAPAYLNGQRDDYFEECKTLIASRAAYAEILNSVPLANLPPVRAMLDSYANSTEPKNEQDLDQLASRSFSGARDLLRAESTKLENEVNKDGGAAFDRRARYSLLSDPRLIAEVVKSSGGDSDVKNLVCSVDARFHKGSDALSTNIFIASTVLGGVGGMSYKVGSTAVKLAEFADAARAGGLLSTNGVRILKAASLVTAESTNAVGAYSSIVDACSSDAGPNWMARARASSNCVSTPTVEQVKRDSCILSKTLGLLGSKVAGAALKPLIAAGQSLGGKAAILAAPISRVAENEEQPLAAALSKSDLAPKKSSIGELEEYIKGNGAKNSQPEKNSHTLLKNNGKTTLKIGYLSRDESQFMRLVMRAIKDGSIDEIDAGAIVGAKVPNLLYRLAASKNKIGKPIVFKGSFAPEELEGSMLTSLRDPDSPEKSLPHEFSDQDVKDFETAMKELKVHEACKAIWQTEVLAGCKALTFEFRSDQIDQISWKKASF